MCNRLNDLSFELLRAEQWKISYPDVERTVKNESGKKPKFRRGKTDQGQRRGNLDCDLRV